MIALTIMTVLSFFGGALLALRLLRRPLVEEPEELARPEADLREPEPRLLPAARMESAPV